MTCRAPLERNSACQIHVVAIRNRFATEVDVYGWPSPRT